MAKRKVIPETELRAAVERIRELAHSHHLDLALTQAESAQQVHADVVRQRASAQARLEKLELSGGAVSKKYPTPEQDGERLKRARHSVRDINSNFVLAQRQIVISRLRLAEIFLRLADERAFKKLFVK
jgi:hypothetical protein